MKENESTIYAGSRSFEVRDELNDLSFPVLVQYPTHQPSSTVNFGPYPMDVSINSEPMEGKLPLIIISHGNSGSHFIYRTIGLYLARQGYIVAMIEHYGNNRNNNNLGNSVKNLQYRPLHVSQTIDFLLSEPLIGNHISEDKIGIIGHSFGGYTALALAGGNPCTQDRQPVEVHHDDRVKALVLMAPAGAYFLSEGALENVDLPILVLIGEKDHITPRPWTADVVLNGVADPSKVKVQVIENGGHFSFISPFPQKMRNPGFMPANDPPGFDRDAFHEQLPVDIGEFLEEHLGGVT